MALNVVDPLPGEVDERGKVLVIRHGLGRWDGLASHWLMAPELVAIPAWLTPMIICWCARPLRAKVWRSS